MDDERDRLVELELGLVRVAWRDPKVESDLLNVRRPPGAVNRGWMIVRYPKV